MKRNVFASTNNISNKKFSNGTIILDLSSNKLYLSTGHTNIEIGTLPELEVYNRNGKISSNTYSKVLLDNSNQHLDMFIDKPLKNVIKNFILGWKYKTARITTHDLTTFELNCDFPELKLEYKQNIEEENTLKDDFGLVVNKWYATPVNIVCKGILQQEIDIAMENPTLGGNYGKLLATNDNASLLVICSDQRDTNGILLYKRNEFGLWIMKTNINYNEQINSISMSGNGVVLAIGCTELQNGEKGYSQFFDLTDLENPKLSNQKLVGSGGSDKDRQGETVYLNKKGTRIFIGSQNTNSVWVWSVEENSKEIQKIVPEGYDGCNTGFGSCMSLSDDGDILVIGFPRDGSVWIYKLYKGFYREFSKTTENNISRLVSPEPKLPIGDNVSISGDGKILLTSCSSAIYIYHTEHLFSIDIPNFPKTATPYNVITNKIKNVSSTSINFAKISNDGRTIVAHITNFIKKQKEIVFYRFLNQKWELYQSFKCQTNSEDIEFDSFAMSRYNKNTFFSNSEEQKIFILN